MCNCKNSFPYENRCSPDDEDFPSCRCKRKTLLDTLLIDEVLLLSALEGDFTYLSNYLEEGDIATVVRGFYRAIGL